MKQDNKNDLWLFLLIITSISISLIPILLMRYNILASNAHQDAGELLGYALGHAIILIIIPLFINIIVSYFKKETRKRWWLIWIVFLIVGVCSFNHYIGEFINNMDSINKRQFSEGCVHGVKKRALENNVKLEDSTLSQLKERCSKMSEIYYSCLKQGGTREACMADAAKI